MTPAPKYALVALLHRAGPEGVWEHALYRELRPRYDATSLNGVREDLVSLSTIGWVDTVDEHEHRGALVRRYALADHIRPFVEYQLGLPVLVDWLDRTATPAGAGSLTGSRT